MLNYQDIKNDIRKIISITPIFKKSYIYSYRITYKNLNNNLVMKYLSALYILKLNNDLSLNIPMRLKNYLENNLFY
jgi:hypothetical protein